MWSVVFVLWLKGIVICVGLGFVWFRFYGVWGCLLCVFGLVWKFMDVGGFGLFFRVFVFWWVCSVSEILGVVVVCVELLFGDVVVVVSVCGWLGGIECLVFRWSFIEVVVVF